MSINNEVIRQRNGGVLQGAVLGGGPEREETERY